MIESIKIKYFEFVLTRLLDWYDESGCGSRENNDLSILKSLKLLFFVSAARADVGINNSLVDHVFDDFWAMPYGHVELSIYKYIKHQGGKLNFYYIDDIKAIKTKEPVFSDLDPQFLEEIERSIVFLKKQNPSMICMSAFMLVDLSHSWYSWQSNYQRATAQGKKREQINAEIIKTEDKSFSLFPF